MEVYKDKMTVVWLRGFIKGMAQGKLTSSEDHFVHMV